MKIERGKNISEDTVERALKDEGFCYKRPKKSMPFTAPSKEEKLLRVNTILSEIKEMLDKEQTEVFAVDNGHFSTESLSYKRMVLKRRTFFPCRHQSKNKTARYLVY